MRPKTPEPSPSAPDAEPTVRIPLSVVEDPQREDLESMTPEELSTWRALRRKFFRAECGHPRFDPRRLLGMRERDRERWRERRRRWLEKIFANDPRVDVGS